MNARERLTVVLLEGKVPDRIPWAPLIDGYYMSSRPPGMDILEAFREIGADAMERHVWVYHTNLDVSKDPGSLRPLLKQGAITFAEGDIKVTVRLEDHPRGRLFTKIYDVSGHILVQKALYTSESPFIPFPMEPLIKTVEDLEVYSYIAKQIKYLPDYDAFITEDQRIGEQGLATTTGPCSPIQDLLQHTIGIQPFYTKFLTKQRTKLEALMKTMHEKNLEAYEVIGHSPATVVIDYENTSTTYISPEVYKTYASPCINDYADLCHKYDKVFLTHRCGLLKSLVDIIREERDDGVADITPPPTGDLHLWEAKKAWPNKVVIGGIAPTSFTHWSPKQVTDYVQAILQKIRKEDRVILGSGDAVPKDAKVENLKAVGKVIRERCKWVGSDA